jgi:hypothetical protein
MNAGFLLSFLLWRILAIGAERFVLPKTAQILLGFSCAPFPSFRDF